MAKVSDKEFGASHHDRKGVGAHSRGAGIMCDTRRDCKWHHVGAMEDLDLIRCEVLVVGRFP